MTEHRTTCRPIDREYAALVMTLSHDDLVAEFGMGPYELWTLSDGEFDALARKKPLEIFAIFGNVTPEEYCQTVLCRMPDDVLTRMLCWMCGVNSEPFVSLSEAELDATFLHRIGPAAMAILALPLDEYQRFFEKLTGTNDASAAFYAVTGRPLNVTH